MFRKKRFSIWLLSCFLFIFSASCTGCVQKEPEAKEYFKKAYQFIDAGYPQEALELLNMAVEKDPKFIEAYYNRGVVLFSINRDQEAMKDFQKVTELNPDFARAYAGLGSIYESLNNQSEAIKNYRIAARLGNKETQDYLKQKGITW
ncbi:MAG: tetratricopeptide repeat protein [Proteobacteria bacterium]|nr:tetratricopeptide repeat protein [Pseudomonadota bacterium]